MLNYLGLGDNFDGNSKLDVFINTFMKHLNPLLKYTYHFAVITLVPLSNWRFYLRYSDYDKTEVLISIGG